MSSAQEIFDAVAEDFDAARRAYSTELGEILGGFGFTPGATVLDVGCGTGAATALLADRGCVMTGVDRSQKMLEIAQRRLPDVKFVVGSAEALPFKPRTFDGVISAQTFHHLDQPKAFAEAIRVTKPGGRVALFWKLYAYEEPVRLLREQAYRAFGTEPPAEPLARGFRAFYRAPFADRALKAVPTLARSTVDAEVAHERSRARTREVTGDRIDEFSRLFREKLVERFGAPDAPILMRCVQWLYVGAVGQCTPSEMP